MAWDYARLWWGDRGGSVNFTCQDDWKDIPEQYYMSVLAELGAMGWELVSVGWDVNVHGQSNPYGGSTHTTSIQHMLFKRPWMEGGQEAYLQRTSQWVTRQVNEQDLDEVREYVEAKVAAGVPVWKYLPDVAPTLQTTRMHTTLGLRSDMSVSEMVEAMRKARRGKAF